MAFKKFKLASEPRWHYPGMIGVQRYGELLQITFYGWLKEHIGDATHVEFYRDPDLIGFLGFKFVTAADDSSRRLCLVSTQCPQWQTSARILCKQLGLKIPAGTTRIPAHWDEEKKLLIADLSSLMERAG